MSKPLAKPPTASTPLDKSVTASAPKPGAKSSSKNSAKTPAPAPAPSTSRFAERFAPPKPPARGYPEPMDFVKTAHKADPKLVNAWKTKAGRDLTEPELFSMPEDEYMNDKQLEFFRVRLQALKDDLLSNAGETTEHLREDTTIVPDHDRGGARAGTANPRPRTQAAQENHAVAGQDRRQRLWFLR